MAPSSMTFKTKTHVCPHQIAFLLDNWLRRLIQDPQKIAGEYIQPGDTVFDIGCGPGYFSIDLAKMVGDSGRVVAVDIQPSMLAKVEKKAAKHGVSRRMVFHRCGSRQIGLNQTADFILAFYMVHETPVPTDFLAELRSLLKTDGKLLVVEPRMHVSKTQFQSMVQAADSVGLKALDFPKGKGGRSVLFGVDADFKA